MKPEIHVVLRMFDQELASKIRAAFDIRRAFSTASVAAPLFAMASSDKSIENSFYVGDRLLVVAHMVIKTGSKLLGKRIRDIGVEHRAFLLSHTREGEQTHFPSADTTFQVGDRVTVQTEPPTLKLLHQMNNGR